MSQHMPSPAPIRQVRSGHHMEKKQNQIVALMHLERPEDVSAEVRQLVLSVYPRFDFSYFDGTFADTVRLFRGDYPGYRKCNVRYHDLTHTMLVLLAMARLIHGALISGQEISEKGVTLGLMSALTHDAGYIQTSSETTGTGAQYTLVHIKRSIDFVRGYLSKDDLWKGELKRFSDILRCTGLDTKVSRIRFSSPETELLGQMLGTADLLGQMADRVYLEKLHSLYYEFKEAHVPGFDSEVDLLQKTLAFYEETKRRLVHELGNTRTFMLAHFKSRYGIDRDLYSEYISRNMAYLDYVITHHREDYTQYLRRGNVASFLPFQG